MIAALLKKFGITKLKIANNGEEAFEYASREKFDIVKKFLEKINFTDSDGCNDACHGWSNQLQENSD